MADKLGARQRVVDLARSLRGSHYLWGAAGATPGGRDGSPHRPASVTLAKPSLDPRSPCLNAAQCAASGSLYVCAGRCVKAHGAVVEPTDVVRNKDLTDFVTTFRAEGWNVYMLGYADERRSYFLNLTPRVIIGDNIDSKFQGRIAWGEDCRWKRHFDCIGFINYVFNQTTHDPYTPGQPYSASIDQWVGFTTEVKLNDPPVPADILFRQGLDPKTGQMVWHHIALLGESGKVLQAEEAVMGVHEDQPYNNGASWTSRRRLGNEFFPSD